VTFWNTQTLKTRIPAQGIIEPYDEARVTHAAYEMAVGGEAFVTSNASDKTQLSPGAKVVIPPGQFGLLTTQETLRIPPDVIALISIRASIKFQGLVNVSGFHVDPGYAGPLKFAVYNAGSQPIVLDQGQRVFMIWLTSLDESDADPYRPKSAQAVVISAADVAKIQGDVASPAALKKQIDELQQELNRRFHTMQLDIDKKWHATEQLHLNQKWAIGVAIGVIVTLLSGILILMLRGRMERPAATLPSLQPQQTAPALPATLRQQAPPGPTAPESTGRQGQKVRGPQ
jgi:dCTP deaminase